MQEQKLRDYAKLIVVTGGRVQPGQEVYLTAALDQPEFVAMVVEECYRAGASRVVVDWSCQAVSKLHQLYCTEETLSKVSPWREALIAWQAENFPVRIALRSDDPDGMNGVDAAKAGRARAAQAAVTKPYIDRMTNHYQWCLAAVPSVGWAKKVFPELSAEDAVERLWETILSCSRADHDPIAQWEEHNRNLHRQCDKLNAYDFVSLHYTSKNGTDFTVGLIDEAEFIGGAKETAEGAPYNPNIPSEEVFTTPKKGMAEGTLVATKPLSYQGQLIEHFSITFHNGKAVSWHAEKGEEALSQIILADENSGYLGEVALVPFRSAINDTGILFYMTLFDENASCHVALGKGYSNAIKEFGRYTNAEFAAMGVNSSSVHVDFMVGSADLSIVGTTRDGRQIAIFENGDWAI